MSRVTRSQKRQLDEQERNETSRQRTLRGEAITDANIMDIDNEAPVVPEVPPMGAREEIGAEQPNEEHMRNILRGAVDSNDMRVGSLQLVLPTISSDGKVSDEAIERLAACFGIDPNGHNSDDSIISEIDHMDIEEIRQRDARFRKTMEEHKKFKDSMKPVKGILKIGKETKKEREERRRIMRESKMGNATKEEKEEAEKRRLEGLKELKKRLKVNVNVFENEAPSFDRKKFSDILQALAHLINNDPEKSHNDIVQEIDIEMFKMGLESAGISASPHSREDLARYSKRKVCELFANNDIMDVFGGRYGFNFGAKQCVMSLHELYCLVEQSRNAHPLSISISWLVKKSFVVARRHNDQFRPNEALKIVLFG